ncbi:hypothetical protein C4D60_Mb02t21320 [Musa balbisiana]|uniref:Uncharacterized protein n=1 Tax=Musa balbisiana TaxID=52838 RepID=A0A4S8IDN2_MUSBA|nr:hypothetical protein C4D60_Mb02t21320 [Musa balbisiana]
MGFRYCRRTTLRCLQSTRGRFLFRLEAIGGSNSRDHFLGLCGGGGGARAAGGSPEETTYAFSSGYTKLIWEASQFLKLPILLFINI